LGIGESSTIGLAWRKAGAAREQRRRSTARDAIIAHPGTEPAAIAAESIPLEDDWKEIQCVTPTGESGVLTRGLQGFAAEPTVTCTYIGAVSGNDYTVIGFYPEK
jgi:hypothetical protein